MASGEFYQRSLTDENFEKVDKLSAFARERGHTVGELALAWLLANPAVCSVIAGATSPEQVAQNVAAADWSLTPDDLKGIDEIVPPPESPSP